MESLTMNSHNATAEEAIENWDDEDLDIGGDDFVLRSASLATTAPSNHRDSISSRLSLRSEFESNHGDEEKHVHLPGDDERSTIDAIATATRAGIPIPKNVPSSALMGGTIKRLGGRKIKKIIQDDWDDGDLELPEGGFKIKNQEGSNFPDALRQVSGPGSLQPSPSKQSTLQAAPKFSLGRRPDLKPTTASTNLDRFRDDDDDDFLGDGGATIKVAKSRSAPKVIPLITPPTPQKNSQAEEDFEQDFQLPSGNSPLKLSNRKEIPQTPVSVQEDEFDEWGEGSLGTRFGGTRREGRSNRSSSISALSPSVSNVSSSLTVESEDEGLDGLILPNGPLHFDDILKRSQRDRSLEHQSSEAQPGKPTAAKDDFLSGLEIGDGDIFNSNKLSLNRNIKVKSIRQASPTRPKTAVSLTFTNKPTPVVNQRLPRPSASLERVSSSLEPVSESGGPIANRARRSQSRLGSHSAQSSITSIPTPTTPSSVHSLPPSTPRRRELASKQSTTTLRSEPTTTNAQLLKLKRSMPSMRSYPESPAKPNSSRYARPPSRTESGTRPTSVSRPKTPIERDRSGAESSMSHARKNPLPPFLPAGGLNSQSHHVTIKASRTFRRHDSESSTHSTECRPASRAVSRSTMRSPSPRRNLRGAAEALAREAAVKRQITKPVRRRHFGDGCELDGFDDLPTSQAVEQKFIKQPIARSAPKSLLRTMIHQNVLPERSQTASPVPLTPYSPSKAYENLPRFARDTNASRMAREHVLSQRAPSASGAPLATLTNQWKAQISAKTGLNPANSQQPTRSKKSHGPPQKPQLIKPLGNLNNPKSVKGMWYNPHTYRWEGNENDLTPFDAPASSPSTTSLPSYMFREKENSTPRPALITNINSSQGVQVVGGMVFDPHRMCWLKIAPQSRNSKSSAADTLDEFDALDDEEDVFKDVPDLEDSPTKEDVDVGGMKSDRTSGLKDEWLVGEEFDVGPEFVKRQREEEERWRRKCEGWVGAQRESGGEAWRWDIREVVNEQ